LRGALLILAAAGLSLAIFGGAGPALAIQTSGSPRPSTVAAPTPQPLPANATELPLDSSLFFVLDGTIASNSSKAGSFVRAHLRDPIVLDGVTIARKGAPVQIEVVQAEGAQIGNVDGSVEIYFEPLTLSDGKTLTLNTPTEHIDPHMSSGQANTRGITDTVGDIFVPYHALYHMLRKGQQVVLRPGTVLRARTAENLALLGGSVELATPPPFSYSSDKPQSHFAPVPLATPRDNPFSTPKPSPTASPSPIPTTTPSP
jgi:hypothetical protein